MLASSVLMMGAMTVAHADEQAPAKVNKQQVASQHKHQHHAAKHHRQHANNVTTASAHHGHQYAAAKSSQQFSEKNSQGTFPAAEAQQQQHKGVADKAG